MLSWLRLIFFFVCVFSPSQLFKGKFYYCVGFDVKNITNKSDCLAANYRWVHHKYNFDNLGQVREREILHLGNPVWIFVHILLFWMYNVNNSVHTDEKKMKKYVDELKRFIFHIVTDSI